MMTAKSCAPAVASSKKRLQQVRQHQCIGAEAMYTSHII